MSKSTTNSIKKPINKGVLIENETVYLVFWEDGNITANEDKNIANCIYNNLIKMGFKANRPVKYVKDY